MIKFLFLNGIVTCNEVESYSKEMRNYFKRGLYG